MSKPFERACVKPKAPPRCGHPDTVLNPKIGNIIRFEDGEICFDDISIYRCLKALKMFADNGRLVMKGMHIDGCAWLS
jgi:hypothetical protein